VGRSDRKHVRRPGEAPPIMGAATPNDLAAGQRQPGPSLTPRYR
jgi:hypothetical protein